MKYWKILTIGLLVILLSLFSCKPAPKPTPFTITDQLGRGVRIEKVPERIVSLSPSNTEILFALGLGDRVVGVTQFCNYPPEVEELKKAGKIEVIGGFTTPDIEKIIALSPDIILATGIHEKEVIPKLEGRGLTVFALEPKNLDEILEGIKMVGRIAGVEKRARDLTSRMEKKIKEIEEKVAGLKKPRVFYIVWHEPIWTCGSETFADALIEKAGGTNIFKDIKGWKMVDIEEVIARDPQVIIACTGHGEARDLPFKFAKEDPRLSGTEARRNNRIYQVEADIVARPGPRIVEALEEFARFIHPEVFEKAKGAVFVP